MRKLILFLFATVNISFATTFFDSIYLNIQKQSIRTMDVYSPDSVNLKILNGWYNCIIGYKVSSDLLTDMANNGSMAKMIKKVFDLSPIFGAGYTNWDIAHKVANSSDTNYVGIIISSSISALFQGLNLFWIDNLVEESKFINNSGDQLRKISADIEVIRNKLKEMINQ